MYQLKFRKLVVSYIQILLMSMFSIMVCLLMAAAELLAFIIQDNKQNPVEGDVAPDYAGAADIREGMELGFKFALWLIFIGSLIQMIRYLPRYLRTGMSYLQIDTVQRSVTSISVRRALLNKGHRKDFLDVKRRSLLKRALSNYDCAMEMAYLENLRRQLLGLPSKHDSIKSTLKSNYETALVKAQAYEFSGKPPLRKKRRPRQPQIIKRLPTDRLPPRNLRKRTPAAH